MNKDKTLTLYPSPYVRGKLEGVAFFPQRVPPSPRYRVGVAGPPV